MTREVISMVRQFVIAVLVVGCWAAITMSIFLMATTALGLGW